MKNDSDLTKEIISLDKEKSEFVNSANLGNKLSLREEANHCYFFLSDFKPNLKFILIDEDGKDDVIGTNQKKNINFNIRTINDDKYESLFSC